MPFKPGHIPYSKGKHHLPKPVHVPKRYPKRRDKPTDTEKALIAQVVADQPGGILPSQVTALATALRRPKELTKQLVEEAKENFVASAGRYVDIHKEATEAALANGDSKSLEVAVRGSQWALENLSAEGVRIVDKVSTESTGPKIMIGIKLGGMTDAVVATKIDKLP